MTNASKRREIKTMSDEPIDRRYQIHDAINAWVYENPDRADLHDPDTVKELSRWIRDRTPPDAD